MSNLITTLRAYGLSEDPLEEREEVGAGYAAGGREKAMLGEFVQALASLKGATDVMGLEAAIGRTGSREFDRLA